HNSGWSIVRAVCCFKLGKVGRPSFLDLRRIAFPSVKQQTALVDRWDGVPTPLYPALAIGYETPPREGSCYPFVGRLLVKSPSTGAPGDGWATSAMGGNMAGGRRQEKFLGPRTRRSGRGLSLANPPQADARARPRRRHHGAHGDRHAQGLVFLPRHP